MNKKQARMLMRYHDGEGDETVNREVHRLLRNDPAAAGYLEALSGLSSAAESLDAADEDPYRCGRILAGIEINEYPSTRNQTHRLRFVPSLLVGTAAASLLISILLLSDILELAAAATILRIM